MRPDDDETRAVRVLSNGTVVDHYRIIEKIGAGGMGEVYVADDLNLNRKVALKFLPDALSQDNQAVERFVREARAAAGLNHPNICSVIAIDESDGRMFIVMEFVEGPSLRAWLRGIALRRASSPCDAAPAN